MKLILVGVLLLAPVQLFGLDLSLLENAAKQAAKEPSPEDMQVLYDAALQYIETHSSEKENEVWNRQWMARVGQADLEGENEEKFTLRVLQTFVEDNHAKISNPDQVDPKLLLQASRLFCLCHQKEYLLPARIREHITPSIAKKVSDFLGRQ